MKFETNKFAMAAAATLGAVYTVCAAIVLVAPGAAATLLGWVFHIVNLETIIAATTITLGGFVLGLVQILAYAYIIAFVFAYFYNSFTS